MRKLSGILLAACMAYILLMPTGLYAAGASDTTIYVDGSPVSTSTIMQYNHQMVPAVFFRSMRAGVSWSVKFRSAVVSRSNITLGFPSGKSFADYELQKTNQWQRDYLTTMTVNDGGKIYVPLAYTARKLGLEVKYDARLKRTSISTTGQNGIHSQSLAIHTAGQVSASQDDLKWLYQITEAEAGGESYTGKTAIAATILNRVNSPDWPMTIQETIFHVTHYNGVSYYQYSPVIDNRIYNVTPSDETKKAVQAALNGEDPSKGAVVFYNPDKTNNQWVRSREVTVIIGNHVFAK